MRQLRSSYPKSSICFRSMSATTDFNSPEAGLTRFSKAQRI